MADNGELLVADQGSSVTMLDLRQLWARLKELGLDLSGVPAAEP